MTNRKQKLTVGPRCPNCGKPPYDITSFGKDEDGVLRKSIVWFCPDVKCNPWGRVMSDKEVWELES